jgi:ornithine decarboxylase
MDSYFNEIKKGLDNLKLEKLPEIICEPGRALGCRKWLLQL